MDAFGPFAGSARVGSYSKFALVLAAACAACGAAAWAHGLAGPVAECGRSSGRVPEELAARVVGHVRPRLQDLRGQEHRPAFETVRGIGRALPEGVRRGAWRGHDNVRASHAWRSRRACAWVKKGPARAGLASSRRRRASAPGVVVRSVSHHQLGIALDVRAGTGSEDEFICLQEFAQLNPQLGVRFPLGKHDYPHMEPGGSRPGFRQGRRRSCLRAASVTPCNKMRIMLTDTPAD